MCGIAGIFNSKAEKSEDGRIIREMAAALAHRGPDDEGFYNDELVSLGFRRLSIIGLSSGKQPIKNEDGSIVVVCNGEIFNYKALRDSLQKNGHVFTTDCDVEVIPHLYEEYGVECMNKLNGQFSFALWDRRLRSMLLVRDHIGIAPLFYHCSDGTLLFASEIKGLLKHPSVTKGVNLRGLDQILSYPGMVSPETMFQNIKSLKPGHYLLATEQGYSVNEYWDLNYPMKDSHGEYHADAYYIEALTEHLLKAVRYRLQADVPVGYYISGGLDSSLICAMAQSIDHGTRRKSFSMVFEDAAINERDYQRLMSKHLSSLHTEIMFHPDDFVKKLRDVVLHAEAPVKESYNACSLSLSQAVRQNGIKVILTGEGADEFFAGYVGYRFDVHRAAQADDFTLLEREQEENWRQQLWGDRSLLYERPLIDIHEMKTALYSPQVFERLQDFNAMTSGVVNTARLMGRNKLDQRSYLDLKLRISDHLVADHGDRVAYANSVEARYPFLDVELIEFVKTIPPHLKLNGLSEKFILKKIAEKYVPESIWKREKFSFVAPSSPALLRMNTDFVNDILSYDTIRRQGYFNPDVIERLKKKYSASGFTLNQTFENDLLMIVLTFGIFLDVFGMPDHC